MLLRATCTLEMTAAMPVPTILMLRPKSGIGQFVLQQTFHLHPYTGMTEFTDAYGNLCQRLTIPTGDFRLESTVTVDCADYVDVNIYAPVTTPDLLPDEVLQFLLPSRYCESDKCNELATQIVTGALPGYPQVQAITRWVHTQFRYEYGSTNGSVSACDVIEAKVGVCRDFAHVGIALCRSLNIPARMVVGYLYQLDPMDLHAWFEAYVGGRWYTFDATPSSLMGKRIALGYGRDAADVAFATHFGQVTLTSMTVSVEAATWPAR
jgi:transglutaminase-like putative cysteine protease